MRAFYYYFVACLILNTTFSPCYGQYFFKHYQGDDGLLHNSVTAVLQDSKGLIWIGTRSGLNRFDGYSFKTFKNKNNKLGSIGNNIINAIAEDKRGMLWIGTGKGVFKYDPYREIFVELKNWPEVYISQVVVDRDNNLWFLANYTLYKYNQGNNKLEHLKIHASCMTIDGSMNVWLGDDDGMIGIYNYQTKTVSKIRMISNDVPANLRSISKIYPVNNEEILVGCFKQGLKNFNPQTGSVTSISLNHNENTAVYVRDIAAANSQQYWIATESGIYIYDLHKQTIENLRKHSGDPYSLADNAVYSLCKDNQGGMWVGTFFGGLNYYSPENSRFEKYYPQPGANSISGDAVREICKDSEGNLWIGTEDAGINKFDLQTKKFTNYTTTEKETSISYPNIHGMLALDDQLFIGPFLQGLEIMNMRTGLITDRFKLIGGSGGKTSDFVISIYLTKDSTLLVGTAYHNAGLFSYDRRQKKFTRIKQIPDNTYVFDILEDSQGNIWTGSVTQGAFYYNPKTGKQGNLRFGDTTKNNLINEFAVYNIFEDSNHNLWFATTGGGLIKVGPDKKVIKRFTTENGLPANVVYSILEDSAKHLWISSLKGLIRLDLATEQITVYTQANGLITDQFNYNSAYKNSDGKMYFGSVKGMIAFKPSAFDQKEASPPTYITGFQINNKEVIPNDEHSPLRRSILFTDTIALRYDQNNFSIEFAALNYSSPQVTRYKYLMKGLSNAWTYLNTNRNAYFTELKPGNYEFIVQAESNIGSWTGEAQHLFIKIYPPFWKSTMAYVVYALLIAFSLYLSVRFYHRYQERKNLRKLLLFEHEKEKEIYQAKIEFFTNITHEIQTPLTLIAGPIEWLIKKFEKEDAVKKNLMIAEKNAKRLVALTSQLLDFRKTEVDQFSLNFVKTDISVLLEDLVSAFKQEALNNNIHLDFEAPADHIIAFVDREALIKISSNLISNAIKYAATKATVTASSIADEDFFTLRFSNDGEGIGKEHRDKIFEPFFRIEGKDKPGTGIGLSLAKSLTELHSGTLTLVSGETDSIIFELRLPVRQKFEFQLSNWKKIK